MNVRFRPFAEFVGQLRQRDKLSQRDMRSSPEGREFIYVCNGHAGQYATGTIGEANIVPIHPFYHEINFCAPPPLERYALVSLLRQAGGGRFRRVLFESYLDYPDGSADIVEEGLIDSVIFTVPRDGIPVRYGDMKGFGGSHENYVGGCYGEICVPEVMKKIIRRAPSSVTTLISDAVVFYRTYDDVAGRDNSPLDINALLSHLGGGITSTKLLQMQGANDSYCGPDGHVRFSDFWSRALNMGI